MAAPFIIFFVLLANLVTAAPVQADVKIKDARVDYAFGSTLTFTASLAVDAEIDSVFLFYQPEGDKPQVVLVAADDEGRINHTLQADKLHFTPFARIFYWFQVKMLTGDTVTSPTFWFDYLDNRFEWQTLADDQFRVFWVEGDPGFGQALLNTAHSGLENLRTILPVTLPSHTIDIYTYTRMSDLQSALQSGGTNWVAGQANPEIGVIMVSIAPGPEQSILMQQQIPHELAHLALYNMTGSGYSRLPVWLREGIASQAELYPNPDYAYALETSSRDNSLLPIETLCTTFPRDASNAFLAYAEATSFTYYIYQNYGSSGLQAMIDKYMDGYGCTEGAAVALGKPLNSVEYRWRQEYLGMNAVELAWGNLLPYLALFAVVVGISIISMLYLRQKITG